MNKKTTKLMATALTATMGAGMATQLVQAAEVTPYEAALEAVITMEKDPSGANIDKAYNAVVALKAGAQKDALNKRVEKVAAPHHKAVYDIMVTARTNKDLKTIGDARKAVAGMAKIFIKDAYTWSSELDNFTIEYQKTVVDTLNAISNGKEEVKQATINKLREIIVGLELQRSNEGLLKLVLDYSATLDKVQMDYVNEVLAEVKAAKTTEELNVAKAKYNDLLTMKDEALKAAVQSNIGAVIATKEVELAIPRVESVSAINGSQLEVKFSREVDRASAENASNYTILRNAATEAGFNLELQEDDKTVIITLSTPVANTTTADFSITIQNVLLKGSYYDTIKYYASSLLVADTKAPEIVSVTSKTNADTASSVTVTFSEPVASPTLKVNGVTKPASLSADGYTATINNLDLSVTGTHTIEAVNLTDLSSNVTATTTKTFTVTKDTNAATYTVSTQSDNAILLTYNKAMNASTVIAGITLKGEDLNDLPGGDYTVSAVGSSNKVFKIRVNSNPFTTTKTSYKYTIVTKNTIADNLGNLSPATTNYATLSVDTVKPTVQSVNYVKDNTGKVTKLLVKYSEAVTAQAGTIDIKDLTDGTIDASVTATGTVLADGKTVEYTLVAATALTGEYEVSLPAGIVKDTAFGTNASVLTKQTVNFGAANATTLKVTSATVASNVATVNFDKDVTYSSATNPANYTINGVALPAGTVINYVTTKQVTFTLPANFIATTDTGAILRVANVKTASGAVVSPNQTVVSVTDNTSPVFTKTAINADGTVSLTFSEAVVSSTGSIADFTFAVNNKNVTVGSGNVAVADGTGADAGKYVFTFSTSVDTTSETGVGNKDATATVYFDVDGDGDYSSTVDVLIQKYTGLAEADLAGYTPATYNASKFSSLVIGSTSSPTVVKDTTGNVLKGDQAITVK